MKKLLLLAVTLLVALNLTGCVTLHSETEIEGDGSGTAELMMSIAPEIKEALLEMQALDTGAGADMDMPLLDDLSRADIEKAAKGHDVEVKKFERGTVEGRETLTIALAFEDLKGFSYVMNRVMGGNEAGGGMGIFDAGEGNFILKPTQYDFPPEPAEEAEDEAPAAPQNMDPAVAQKQMEIAGKLMAAMAELDVRLTVTVPGEIISSNAPTTEGRTSIWAVNAGNMMTMEQEFSPEIVFAGEGLELKALEE